MTQMEVKQVKDVLVLVEDRKLATIELIKRAS
jgi:hypothetical protein